MARDAQIIKDGAPPAFVGGGERGGCELSFEAGDERTFIGGRFAEFAPRAGEGGIERRGLKAADLARVKGRKVGGPDATSVDRGQQRRGEARS